MYKTAQDNYGCGLRHAPPVPRQRAALAGRKGHLFLSVKHGRATQPCACGTASAQKGHLFPICTVILYRLIGSLNEFFIFFLFSFPKVPISMNGDSNLETLLTSLPLLLTSLPIQ